MATESPFMEQAAWVVAMEELNELQKMANDVKIIGDLIHRYIHNTYYHKLLFQRLFLSYLVRW